jgi:hypothetical protein
MVHRDCSVPAPRWLLPLLALLLVLGHACELPAYADLVMSPHLPEGAAHGADDHAHDPQMSCDPVDVLASSGAPQVGPDLGAAQVAPFGSPVPVRLLAVSLEGSKRLPSRPPPLFLLHASLLI